MAFDFRLIESSNVAEFLALHDWPALSAAVSISLPSGLPPSSSFICAMDPYSPHPYSHPHFLLETIDNRYRLLISDLEHNHRRTTAELTAGYTTILRLQEAMICRQAEHIAYLEAQNPPPPVPPRSEKRKSTLFNDSEGETVGSGQPKVPPPRSEKRKSAILDGGEEAAGDGFLGVPILVPPLPKKHPGRPKSVVDVDSGLSEPEQRLQRNAKEQIAVWNQLAREKEKEKGKEKEKEKEKEKNATGHDKVKDSENSKMTEEVVGREDKKCEKGKKSPENPPKQRGVFNRLWSRGLRLGRLPSPPITQIL